MLSKRKMLMRLEKRESQLPRLPERLMKKSTMLRLRPGRNSMNFRLSSIKNNWRLRKLSLRRLSSTFGDPDLLAFPLFTALSLTRRWLTRPSPRHSRTLWSPNLLTTLASPIRSRMRLNCTSPTHKLDSTFSLTMRESN